MKLKKLIALGLCSSVAMAMTVPAFAATTSNQTKITATYAEPVIKVKVPTTGTAIINPYKLPYSLGKDGDTDITISGQQIATKPLALVNTGDTALDVNATVTGVIGGDMKLVTAAPSDTETAKNAYMYLEFKTEDSLVSKVESGTVPAAELAKAAKDWSGDPVEDNMVVVCTKSTTKDKIITLAAANADGTVQDGGIAMYRLSGSVVKAPKIAWTTKDKVDVTVAFTFEPSEEASGGDSPTE